MSDKTNTETKTETKAENKVKIRLFRDNNEYKEDLFVAVNGHSFLIKRGVEVEVPDYIADVIKNAEAQQNRALEYMASVSETE